MRTIDIQGRPIGPGHPPYVIAELSGNHNGRLERALELVDAAKAAGVDAVKLQTYTADTITLDSDLPDFRISGGPWDGYRLYDLYREASTPWDWHEQLFERARRHGLAVFSSPFDPTAIAFLETLGAPAYKIASFEVIDLPLVELAARTGKPLIISTGMADLAEIGEVASTVRATGNEAFALLHCVSSYPAPPEDANLLTLPHLAETFGTVVGLSDHTPGTAVATAAVSLGASIVEKHLTLRRADGGPDAAFSLEPHEFKDLVENVHVAHRALGRINYDREPSEKGSLVFRRSLYAVRDIAAGEILTPDNVRSIRPGHGLPPKFLSSVLGRHAVRSIARGTPLDWPLLSADE